MIFDKFHGHVFNKHRFPVFRIDDIEPHYRTVNKAGKIEKENDRKTILVILAAFDSLLPILCYLLVLKRLF